MLVTALFAASFGVRAEEDGAAAPKPEIKNLAKETCRIAYREATADGPAALLIGYHAQEAKPVGGFECPLPDGTDARKQYQMLLRPVFGENGKIESFDVVTWKVPADRPAGDGAAFEVVPGVKESFTNATVLDVGGLWREADTKPALRAFLLKAFRLADAKDGDRIERTTQEIDRAKEPLAMQKRELAIPLTAEADARFGVLVRPIWRDMGKTFEGFDAVLVKTKSEAAEEEIDEPMDDEE
jgi:hypothetical protein